MPITVADQSCTDFDTPNFAAMAAAVGVCRLVCSHATLEMKHFAGADLTVGPIGINTSALIKEFRALGAPRVTASNRSRSVANAKQFVASLPE